MPGKKILICTQKVDKNDDLLGFFHSWIAEFARQCESVAVVCLYQGEYDLPVNVKVMSLGKESSNFRFQISDFRFILKIKYFFRFYKYIWQERRNYDVVFVHMNPIYVILGGLFWRLNGKKIGLWYAHGHVPPELRIAEKFVDHIFTSTAGGCRIVSDKIRVVGQGVGRMPNAECRMASDGYRMPNAECRMASGEGILNKINKNSKLDIRHLTLILITIGRIAPIKNLEILIKAVEILVKKGIDIKLNIVGAIGLAEHKEYYESLVKLVKEKGLEGRVNFIGSVPNTKIAQHLRAADVFVSASTTGSLDKVFLEAIGSGLPVIGCNEALLEVIREYENKLFYPSGDFSALAKKIEEISNMDNNERTAMINHLRAVAEKEHGLVGLVKKIIDLFF